MKYTLGDLTVRRWNDWDRVPRMPEVVIPYIASALTVSTVTATVIYYVGTTLITSWALNALAPKPDFGSLSSNGILVNAKDATAPAEFVYGEVRKGGVVTYYESTGEANKYLHQIIVLAAHEVNSIGDIYINDTVVTLDGSGFVTSDGWDSKIRIQKFDGSQTTAPADLLSESELTGDDALTSNFIGSGLAYLYVRYEYDQDVFASGIPLITAVVQGKKVYDPRTASTAYSNNAALCIRDFLTASYGLNDDAIDETAFAAAANECDETVALDTGGTEKRYTINGIVRADRAVGDVLGDMMAACAGTLFWGSGYWKLKAGAYSSPVKTLTLDDLRSSISLDTRITLRDNFNEVQGTFNDAEQDWITVDYPKLTSTAFLNEDGGAGNETAIDLQLPYTTSASAAQRLAKLTLFRGREQMTVTAEFGMNAFDIEVGDIIAFTNDRYGWDEKEFEVIGWHLAANQDAGDLRVALTLRETSAAAFDWNAEESEIIANNTNLTDPRAGLTISNLTVTDKGNVQTDGTFIGQALVQWTSASSSFLNHYEVQWNDVNETSYQRTEIPADENSVVISPLETGTQYNVRVRGVTVSDVKGTWVSALPYTHGGDTIAPSPVTGLTAVGGPKSAVLDWSAPTTQVGGGNLYDLRGYYIYRNTVNTQPADPIAFSGSDKYVDGGLAVASTYYYWVTAVDFTGNESSAVASGQITSDSIEPTQDTRIYTGVVWYQTLQATAPSTPSATGYSETTLTLSGLTSGWAETQPVVGATDTTVKEWKSSFKAEYDIDDNLSITFSAPTGSFQFTDDIASDNYNGSGDGNTLGTQGWYINRDTGFAEFGSAAIRDTLSVGQVPILPQTQITNLTSDLSTAQSTANTAVADAATAQSTANSKVKTFSQSSTPSASSTGDLWYNTGNGFYYRWTGSSWARTSIQADSVVAGWVYAGTINANNINTGTLNADRLPGLGVGNSTAIVNAGISDNTTTNFSVSFSGAKVGTKCMWILQIDGYSSNESPRITVTPAATNVSRDHTTSTRTWITEGGSTAIREPHTFVCTGTTSSSSGSVGFNVYFNGNDSSSGTFNGVVSALIFKA